MALEGTIKEFGLADIFQLIGLQKKTGVLFLKGAEGTINIHFEDGMVVKVENSRMSHKYLTGNILINRGKITESQVREALEIQKSTGQKIGQVFIGQGLITKDELRDVLIHQMSENIYSAFRWRGGDYKFYQDKVDYDRNTIIPINFENILMDGVRLMDEWPRIEKKLPSQDVVLKKAPGHETDEDEEGSGDDIFASDGGSGHKASGLTKEASTIMRMVDGQKSIYELIEVSSLGEFETCKAIVELVEKGYVVKSGDRPVILADEPLPEITRLPRSGPAPYVPYLPYVFIVLSILVILLQVTGTRKITSAGSKGLSLLKTPIAMNQVMRVYNNSVLYALDFGNYPESVENLAQLDYISDSDTVDPWGSKLSVAVADSSVQVVSPGPDRQSGTPDDISNNP